MSCMSGSTLSSPAGAIVGSSEYAEANLPVSLSKVTCSGSEHNLADCPNVQRGVCGQYDDADVVCHGDLLELTFNVFVYRY